MHLALLQIKTSLLFQKFLQQEAQNKYWKTIIHHHHLHRQFPRTALPMWELCRESFLTRVLFKGKKLPTLHTLDRTLRVCWGTGWQSAAEQKEKLLNGTHSPTTLITSRFYIPLSSLSFYNTEPSISEENTYNTIGKRLPSAMLHRSVVSLLSSFSQSTSEQVAAVGLHRWVLWTMLKLEYILWLTRYTVLKRKISLIPFAIKDSQEKSYGWSVDWWPKLRLLG